MSANFAALLYLVSGALFIMALRGLSSPATSRQGNIYGMVGMGIAILTTLATMHLSPMVIGLVVLGLGIGAVIGGTALAGGVGTIYGAILGALIMQSLQSGMAMVGVDTPFQNIVVGLVLIIAVWVDILYRKRLGLSK